MSGVYIKGLEMPERCEGCVFYSAIKIKPKCGLTGTVILGNGNARLDNCPLIEVKSPHGDLIDRDLWCKVGTFDGVPYKAACKRVLIQAKTVIPADYGDEWEA